MICRFIFKILSELWRRIILLKDNRLKDFYRVLGHTYWQYSVTNIYFRYFYITFFFLSVDEDWYYALE
jgi:hypothetical protein